MAPARGNLSPSCIRLPSSLQVLVHRVVLQRNPNSSKRPNVFVSTHLGEVLQGERLGHVVELRATHGFGHGQHSQTVGGGQLLLWKPANSADGETNVDGGREQKKKKNARLIEADEGENLSPCRSKWRSCETSWRRGKKLEGGGGRRGGGG